MKPIEGLVGAGIQGHTDFEQADRVFDVYLVLEPDIGMCEGLGDRAWLRIMNDGKRWRDPLAWAAHCVGVFAKVYPFGTRVMIPLNEPNLELEGGGDSEEDYRFLGEWWEKFLPEVRRLLVLAGMGDVLIGGPCLSPGHQETDGGRYYRYLVYCLLHIDIICPHYYWYQGGGFLDDPDAIYFSRRIEQDLAYWRELGIPEKPVAITEYNRPVDIDNEGDRNDYVSQVERFNDYMPKVTKIVFLLTNTDASFDRLSLAHMPGSIDQLAEWRANRKTPEPQEENQVPKLSEQYAEQFKAWEAAGGVEDNFLEYLIGTGTVKPDRQQALKVLGNARASIAAAEKVIESFPFPTAPQP